MNSPFSYLPEKFINRLSDIIPQEKLEKVLESFTIKRAGTFRANTLKISADKLEKKLREQGFEVKKISWYINAFLLLHKTQRELTETEEFTQGLLYIQNLSSMVPALVLDPKQNERILDIAAAPGSKTTQMAMIMHNQGEIVANDVSRERMFKLINNLKEQRVTNTKVTRIPGQTLWKQYPEYFDKTLVDVPCSMEGRINLNDSKSYEDWSLGKIKSLVPRQQYLLRSAISATKPGGTIVYSSCTLAPEENEGVIDWTLKKEKDAIEIEPITIEGLHFEQGLTQWHKDYNKQVKNTARILPSETMEGFFVAKMRKLKSTV